MSSRTEPFQSSRLIYRAIEPKTDKDFFIRMQQNAISYQNYNCSLSTPKNSRDAETSLESHQNRLLAVIICLPDATSTPIGLLSLDVPDISRRHHRRALIGLVILDEYQRQGYGGEAIRWCLQWGFERAGLHKIGIECVDWSEGLLKLYKKVGFKVDGTMREHYWFEGKWWDYHMLSMLEDEWRGMREATDDWKPKV